PRWRQGRRRPRRQRRPLENAKGNRMRVPSWLLWRAAVAIVVATAAGWSIVRRGFSARDEPSRIEKLFARRVRALAVPARSRDAKNPVSPTVDALADARAHFADHCAVFHANDGS